MAEGKIDSLSIEIGASSKDAKAAIDNLKKALKELRDILSGEDGSTAKKLKEISEGLKAIKGIGEVSIGNKLPKQLKNLSNAVSEVSSDTIRKLDEMAAAIERLKGIDLRGFSKAVKVAQKAAGPHALQTVSKGDIAQPTTALSKVKDATDKEISDIFKQYKQSGSGTIPSRDNNALAKSFVNAAESAIKVLNVLSSISKVLKQVVQLAIRFGKSLANATIKPLINGAKNLVKNMAGIAKSGIKSLWDHSAISKAVNAYKRLNKVVSTFGRIAFYRAVRSAIKYVTDAFKEGSERAYYFAKQYGEATKYIAEALDNMSSGNFKMTNQLGAAWATLLATLQPIISAIIAMVNRAAAAITQLFAILGGKGTYMKAIDYNKKWAESAGGAAGAAKEWRNQLMGFDEINRLDDQNDGGGGGGGALSDFENMFEEAEITSDLLKNIKKYMNAGEWAKLGEYLGEEFNKMINNIKWAEYGKLIGEKIGHAVTTAYNFFKKADFINLGSQIATFLNNVGDGINFTELGHLSMQISLVLWEVLYGAVVGTDWKQLGADISDYFIGALDELSAFISTLEPTKVAGAIKDFFGNIKVAEITSKLAEVLRKAFTFLSETVRLLIPFDFGSKTANGIGNQIDTKANETTVLGSLKSLLTSAFLGLSAAITYLLPEDLRKNTLEGIQSAITGGEEAGEPIGVIDALKTLLTTALNTLSLGIAELIPGDLGDKLKTEIANKIKENGETGNTSDLSGAINTFIETALQGITSIKVPESIKEAIKNAIINAVKAIPVAEIHNVLSYKLDAAVFGESWAAWVWSKGEYAGKDIVMAMIKGVDEYEPEVEKKVKQTTDNISSDTAGIGNELKATKAEAETVTADMTNAIATAKTDAVGACDETETALDGLETAADAALEDVRGSFDETSKNATDNLGKIDTSCANTGSAFTDVQGVGTSAMSGLDGSVANSASSINSSLASVASQAWNTMNALSQMGSYSLNIGGGRSFSYRPNKGGMFAEGGFPEDGLFFANHGEMVGRFSNGRTAVANNEQITAGIANAVYGAFMSAFSQTGGNGSNNKQPIILNINGREFARATYADQKAVAREHGASLVISG